MVKNLACKKMRLFANFYQNQKKKNFKEFSLENLIVLRLDRVSFVEKF